MSPCRRVIPTMKRHVSSALPAHDHDHKPLSEEWYFDRRVSTPLLSIVFILPLLMLKNIGSLSYTSFIGFLSSLYISLVVVVKYFLIDDDYLNCKNDSDLERNCQSSWTIAATSVSFACTAYECHVSSVPVYFGLKRRSVKRYSVVAITVMSSCLIVYSVTGLFGYLTFNSRTCISGDVLRNYCPRDIPISIARIMIVVSLITLYPITCYVGRSSFDSILIELVTAVKHRSMLSERVQTIRFRLEAIGWFLFTLTLAIFIPDIVVVMRPLGGLASMFMLTFPGLCLLNLLLNNLVQITSQLLRLLLYIVATTYIAFGCYILGSSVTYSIMSEAHLISK
ncbi:sodium-coupled neutral amino acid transporter 7-like isoform X2 [Dysidea avara]|uniref:sodium-coupled neutral amino acid transporter 7-like isoform X2 n=1 Tax=Dysidea avara TaxID=196820 RepID=UPI00331D7C1B